MIVLISKYFKLGVLKTYVCKELLLILSLSNFGAEILIIESWLSLIFN
jgi:hypothetical protein